VISTLEGSPSVTYAHAPLLTMPCLDCGAPAVILSENRPGRLCPVCAVSEYVQLHPLPLPTAV